MPPIWRHIHGLEVDAARLAVALDAVLVAGNRRQLAVASGEVGDGVHRGCAGEDLGMARDEHQRLLAAHAASQYVDTAAVDAEPGERVLDDLRHVREVVDLARVAIGEVLQLPSHPVRVDDDEAGAAGEVAPVARVGEVRCPRDRAARSKSGERRGLIPSAVLSRGR